MQDQVRSPRNSPDSTPEGRRRLRRSPLRMDDANLPDERQEDPLDDDIEMGGALPIPLDFVPSTTTEATKSLPTAASEAQPPLLALVTPRPRNNNNGIHVVERATVVTVTRTENVTDSTPQSDSKSGDLPLGVIIGSVLAGVLIAAAAVGGWIWWGRRLKRKQQRPPYGRKGHGSYSSATRLTAGAAQSQSAEKPTRPGAPGTRGSSTTSGSPSTPSSSNNSPRGSAAGDSRRLSVPNPSRPGPSSPASSTASPTSGSPASSPAGASNPPSVGPAGRSFAPTRPSPLAQGAPRATPSARLNEWAVPVAVDKPAPPPASTSPPLTTASHPAPTIAVSEATSPGGASSSASSSSTPAAYHLSPAAIAKQREATREANRVTNNDEMEGPAPPYTPPAEDTSRDNRVSTQSAVSAASRYTDDEGAYDQYNDQHGAIGVAYTGDEQEHHYPPQQGGATSAQPYAQYPHHYGQQQYGYQQGYNPYNNGGYAQPYDPYHQQHYQQPR